MWSAKFTQHTLSLFQLWNVALFFWASVMLFYHPEANVCVSSTSVTEIPSLDNEKGNQILKCLLFPPHFFLVPASLLISLPPVHQHHRRTGNRHCGQFVTCWLLLHPSQGRTPHTLSLLHRGVSPTGDKQTSQTSSMWAFPQSFRDRLL